jgi:hypothetical protein
MTLESFIVPCREFHGAQFGQILFWHPALSHRFLGNTLPMGIDTRQPQRFKHDR